jgi:heme-degrading monooxygenase HmoA
VTVCGPSVELLTQPPPAEVIARMGAIEGVQMVPAMLVTQQGPDREVGPEGAGAILVLQATFADEERATAFWEIAAGLMEQLATAPGFIRRYNFADGPHYTLIALWRSRDDAHAFFSSDAHQAAMRELYQQRLQYTHFAGLWATDTPRQRVVFCRECDGVTPAIDRACAGCGKELFDPYTSTSHVER